VPLLRHFPQWLAAALAVGPRTAAVVAAACFPARLDMAICVSLGVAVAFVAAGLTGF